MPSYYHVLASDRDTPDSLEVLFTDLSNAELKKQFLKRYAWGRPVWANMRMYNPAEFAKLRVLQTNEPHAAIVDHIKRELSRSADTAHRDPTPEEFAVRAKDMTDVYICGPAGESLWAIVTTNEWALRLILGVPVALATALVLWWLGRS